MEIPAYPHRTGWVPKCIEDFGGGGAYPEIHVAQFPGGQLGSRKKGSNINVTTLVSASASDAAVEKPSSEAIERLRQETEASLEALKAQKAKKNQLAKVVSSLKTQDKYFRYIPDEDAPGYNPAIKERIIRVVEKAIDPLEPAKFRNMTRFNTQERREEPVPIMRAPAPKLTAEQRKEWEVPPCVSNWINPSGHTLPLAMRIQATRKENEVNEINPKLAAFSEALQVAEKAAREELKIKQDLRKQQLLEEEKAREEKLRELAAQARAEKAALLRRSKDEIKRSDSADEDEMHDLLQIEKQRKREIVRELRIQRAREESKRHRTRDISDRID